MKCTPCLIGCALSLLASAAWAEPKNLYNTEVPGSVRCVTPDGTNYESCGGSITLGGADGAITDGASPTIKATVKDYNNSNPLAVVTVDANGDPVSSGGGTQYNQGTATTDTDTLMMAGCVRSDTAAVATGVIDGDRARCIVDSTGRLWVHVGLIDGTVAAVQSGTWNIGSITTLPALPTGSNTIGGVNLSQYTPVSGRLPVDGSGVTQPISAASLPLPSGAATAANQDGIIRDGTGDTTQANVSSGRLHVDGSGVTQPVSGTVNSAQSGTWTVQPGNTQNTTAWLVQPQGNVAHDAVDSGNPVKIGCHARTTNRTAVADADRADVICDDNGQLVVTPMAPRDRVVRSGVVTLSNTTETTLIAAGGAGVFRDLTYLKCTNNSATLVRVDLRDATAGTVIDSWALAASGGGFNLAFSVPYAQATANNNWTVQLSGSVTDVRCSAQAVEKN